MAPEDVNGQSADVLVNILVNDEWLVPPTPNVVSLLYQFQDRQDRGQKWGDAALLARQAVANGSLVFRGDGYE